jgi:hypothetical protein
MTMKRGVRDGERIGGSDAGADDRKGVSAKLRESVVQ